METFSHPSLKGGKRIEPAPGDRSYRDNVAYYERVPAAEIESWTRAKGLDTCSDLEQLYPTLASHLVDSRVLEIGAGGGRVIDWVRRTGVRCHVTGIELAPSRAAFLADKYRGVEGVTVLHADLLGFRSEEPFDLVLWMWSGFLELNPDEKRLALERVRHLSRRGTLFVVDFPLEVKAAPETIKYEGRRWEENDEFGVFTSYLITEEELVEAARAAGFDLVESVAYVTSVSLQRLALVFTAGN